MKYNFISHFLYSSQSTSEDSIEISCLPTSSVVYIQPPEYSFQYSIRIKLLNFNQQQFTQLNISGTQVV